MLASRVADCVRYNGGASLHTTQAAGSRASPTPCAWVSVSALLGRYARGSEERHHRCAPAALGDLKRREAVAVLGGDARTARQEQRHNAQHACGGRKVQEAGGVTCLRLGVGLGLGLGMGLGVGLGLGLGLGL